MRGTDAASDERTGAAIIVTGQRDPLRLNEQAQAGSRLGLTIRETPASIEVLTQDDLRLRGLRTARETFNDVVGAIAGNTVSILQDGVRVSASTIVQRDSNNWHYDRIEVLKGPASVLYGEGALAGVINRVTRKPAIWIDRRGNRPINIPSTTVSASALYTIADRGTLGGFLRHASAFYTDTASTVRVAGHIVPDASLSFPVAPQATVTLRGRNLTDAFYGEYSGYPATNVYIGAPRSFEVAPATRF